MPRSSGRWARSTSPTIAHDRVVHARGKSLRDLVRQRRGDLGRVPDVVVRPGDETAVVEILSAALDADAVVIPFGGGTSISGSLEAPREETRTVISVDLGRMDRGARHRRDLAARARAGRRLRPAARGAAQRARLDLRPLPRLLHPLHARRLDRDALVGHAVRPLRRHRRLDARPPGGHPGRPARQRPVPSTSTGPSVREMVLGSEGRLGIICEATIHVRRAAQGAHDPRLPVPDLGRARSPPCATSRPARPRRRSRAWPTPTETAFSFATKKASTLLDKAQSKALQIFLDASQGLRPRADVPRLHRLRGLRAVRRRAAQGGRADRVPPRRHLHRLQPGRALRPEEVRHALHPRLPARPRRARPTCRRPPRRGASSPASTPR